MTDKLLKISNTHDGRDKFCKAAQYMLKIIISSSSNKETVEWLTPVFNLLRDSRKIFRLGKSFNELIFIIEKLTNELSFKVTPTNLLEVLSKFGYFFYWIFDNLGILSKLKLLSLDPNNMNKYAALAWFTGTVLVLFKQLIELNTLLSDKKKQDPSKTDNVLDKKIFNLYVNIIGKIGDVFPSAQGSNISVMLYGKPFSEVTVGFGGMIAALVALYNL